MALARGIDSSTADFWLGGTVKDTAPLWCSTALTLPDAFNLCVLATGPQAGLLLLPRPFLPSRVALHAARLPGCELRPLPGCKVTGG